MNPLFWYKALQYHAKSKKFKKEEFDLELYLYSKMLTNDMLHYGYFEDTMIKAEEMAPAMVEKAQIKYAQILIELIKDTKGLVLDAGCGMGGLSAMLHDVGIKSEALTPNANQIEHILKKYPHIKTFKCKFEDFLSNQKYNTIIHSESLQYIDLNLAFEKTNNILNENGIWIISDYFRIKQGVNKSGHFLDAFIEKTHEMGWTIVYQQDITQNVLPMLRLIRMYADRFLIPLKHFAFEKLRYKKAWLYYLLSDAKVSIDGKILKELSAIDPNVFLDEKKYMIFVLKRK